MNALRRALVLIAGLAVLSPLASAYYYFVYFAGRTGPFVPVPVKFDLNPSDAYGLPGNRVTYLISDQGPGPLVPGDTFQAVISQIRAAAEVWNGVSTSSIRLAFGGTASLPTQDATPEIDIVFDDDLPPGLLALTKPTTVNNPGSLIANGANFLPIVYSRMQLRKDFTNPAVPDFPMPSYSDIFFTTLVHEFGHALGLQHTWTSSAMSTLITSAATKAAPLGADDIAGISLLYQANGFPAGTGSIAGTISLGGAGVNLASVVALATNGIAVSGISNPDGTYRIDGIPPGQYYVYVHPLPPPQAGEGVPGGIYLPLDGTPAENPFLPNTGFGSQFFGGTTDWTAATQVAVTAGNAANAVNFNVQARSGPAVSSMTTYGFLNSNKVAVGEPPLVSGTNTNVTFTANGILGSNNASAAPGLNVSVLGGPAQILPGGLNYLGNGYLYMVVYANQVSARTPTALAFTLNNDLYVLPAAFTVVPSGPPLISAVSGTTDAQGNASATITGSNLGANTRIVFDGAPASQVQANPDGSLTVAAPPASAGYRAAVEALAADSQTSSQTLTGAPQMFIYSGPSSPSISVNPSTVPAGTDAMVQITGYSTNFVEGQTIAAFGSSDILVKRAWVVSAGRLLVNISVSAAAAPITTAINVTTGLQVTTLGAAFQITAANPGQTSLRTPILNQATQLEGVPAGGTAVINTSGLPSSLAGLTLTIANQRAAFTSGANGQIFAIVPNVLVGPAVVELISPNGSNIPPVLMQVDLPAPTITAVTTPGAGAAAVANPAFHAGDTLFLFVNGLVDQFGNLPPAASVDINIGGIDQTALAVAVGSGGNSVIQFQVPANVPSGAQPVTVRVKTRVSQAFTITIQ